MLCILPREEFRSSGLAKHEPLLATPRSCGGTLLARPGAVGGRCLQRLGAASSFPPEVRLRPFYRMQSGTLRLLFPDLTVAFDEVLVTGQFFQTHWSAGMQPVCTDSDLRTKTKLAAIVESRGCVPENSG